VIHLPTSKYTQTNANHTVKNRTCTMFLLMIYYDHTDPAQSPGIFTSDVVHLQCRMRRMVFHQCAVLYDGPRAPPPIRLGHT